MDSKTCLHLFAFSQNEIQSTNGKKNSHFGKAFNPHCQLAEELLAIL